MPILKWLVLAGNFQGAQDDLVPFTDAVLKLPQLGALPEIAALPADRVFFKLDAVKEFAVRNFTGDDVIGFPRGNLEGLLPQATLAAMESAGVLVPIVRSTPGSVPRSGSAPTTATAPKTVTFSGNAGGASLKLDVTNIDKSDGDDDAASGDDDDSAAHSGDPWPLPRTTGAPVPAPVGVAKTLAHEALRESVLHGEIECTAELLDLRKRFAKSAIPQTLLNMAHRQLQQLQIGNVANGEVFKINAPYDTDLITAEQLDILLPVHSIEAEVFRMNSATLSSVSAWTATQTVYRKLLAALAVMSSIEQVIIESDNLPDNHRRRLGTDESETLFDLRERLFNRIMLVLAKHIDELEKKRCLATVPESQRAFLEAPSTSIAKDSAFRARAAEAAAFVKARGSGDGDGEARRRNSRPFRSSNGGSGGGGSGARARSRSRSRSRSRPRSRPRQQQQASAPAQANSDNNSNNNGGNNNNKNGKQKKNNNKRQQGGNRQ